jgi:hypothetical protein
VNDGLSKLELIFGAVTAAVAVYAASASANGRPA